jgi:pimeloyl-ACP methyl ester carboxylesterase
MPTSAQDSATFDAMGPAHAPLILFVHGSVVTRKMWLRQMYGLCDTYRVLAPDLPGHGALAHIAFTFDASVQRLATLIQAETCGRVIVVGLSLGGYVAVELAHRHPQLIEGLVLSGCSLDCTGLFGLYLRVASSLMKRGWFKLSHARAERMARRLFAPAIAEVAAAQLQAGVYSGSLAQVCGELAGKCCSALLAAFPRPVLVLNGARDRLVSRGAAKFVAAARQGRLQIIAGAGHASNIDRPEEFTRAVREFVQSLSAAG